MNARTQHLPRLHHPGFVLRSLLLLSFQVIAGLALLAATAPNASAQAAGTGAISGRVYNPVSKQYVGNAEVKVVGTNVSDSTESDGTYRLNNVPAGEVTVSVTYTGYTADAARVNVTAGQTATHDFDLTNSSRPAGTSDTVVLQAFNVSSEREGNSKAIMAQRRNMNVSTSVASDIFGDVTDGNVGEFLKYLPGVDVDYVESETRGPRLGGMSAQYVGISFDGVRLASADANRTGNAGGATSFEAFSISSIESIEINRTSSPDNDADTPAGNINMKTKRAFDRKGREFAYNFSENVNSEEFTLSKTYGPGNDKEFKIRPNYSLGYTDVFFNNRVGIIASASHADSYTEQYRHNITYNRTPTAADPRPMVITTLNFKDGAKMITKNTYNVTADFRATSRLTLSATYIYNDYLGQFYNREVNFVAANNNANSVNGRTIVAGDGINTVTTVGTNTARNQNLGGGNASKRTKTITFYPRFELKLNSVVADGGVAYSKSFNNYEALEKGHTSSSATNSIVSDFVATRSDNNSHEWTIKQTAGPDWFNLSNRQNPRAANEGRYAKTELKSGDLNARWITPIRRFPTSFKFGGKWTEEQRNNGNETSYNTYSYIGPGGNIRNADGTIQTTGTWGAYPSRSSWDTGTSNILNVIDLNGNVRPKGITRVDDNQVADLVKAHPEWFVNIASADNYFNAFIAPRRDVDRTITAGYGMTDIKISPQVGIRTGVRWEKTETELTEFDGRTTAEVKAAGFTVDTTGRANTIAGVKYQYETKPRVTRNSEYDNFFPMISVKYDITPKLQFHTGFNKAISRPPTDDITGAWLINDEAQTVKATNPKLLPEYSKNFAARLAYYFEPAGQLSATITQNNIRNLRVSRAGTAEEFGLGDDPTYSSYTFTSIYNAPNPVRYRNLELAYSQTLPFTAEMLRGITFNVSYTRSYADQRLANLLPNRFTSSLGYRYRRFSTRLGVVWRDNTPGQDTDATYGLYRRHDTKYDLGGEYVLNRTVSLFFQGRNILNDGQTWMYTPPGNVEGKGAAVKVYENYGANWNFGVKGRF